MKNQEIHLPTPNPDHPYGGGNGRYRFPDINGMNLLGDNISLPPIVPKSFHIMLTVFHPETLYGMKKVASLLRGPPQTVQTYANPGGI